MRQQRLRRLIVLMVIIVAVTAVSLVVIPASARAEACTPSPTVGCAQIILLPEDTVTGDFFFRLLDENGEEIVTQVATGSTVDIPVPAARVRRIYVENVRDESEEYGDVYIYRDSWVSVWVYGGTTRTFRVWPGKQYIKGYLRLTCGMYSAEPGEDVGCSPIINGTYYPEIAPRETRAIPLVADLYNVTVVPSGANAARYTPEARDFRIYVATGASSYYTTYFYKQTHLTVTLSEPGAVADFYVNDELRATQVPSADLWLEAYTLHKVEARNVTSDGGATHWRDARTWVNFSPGQTRTLSLYLVPPPPGTVPTTAPPPTTPVEEIPGTESPPPTATPIPDAPPAANYTGTFSNIPGAALAIYQHGQELGNRGNAFSKVGDSETSERQFLVPIDENLFDLGPYSYLIGTINHFRGSFGRQSLAAKPGFPVHSIVNPIWADPAFCNPGETPLECEYRNHKPAFALIMVRTWNMDLYYNDLVKVVETSINMGVVPILSTVPEAEPPPWGSASAHNAIIRQVAAEYQVPLWDLWQTTETLGTHGVCETCGDHLTLPPDFRVAYFVSPYIDFGATHRNLEALEVLHAMISQIVLAGG